MIFTPLSGGCAGEKITIYRKTDLKQAELGTPVQEVCRKLGISDTTFHTWRKKYGGISPSERKLMRQVEEKNLRLKKRVADLSPDKAMLQDAQAKKS